MPFASTQPPWPLLQPVRLLGSGRPAAASEPRRCGSNQYGASSGQRRAAARARAAAAAARSARSLRAEGAPRSGGSAARACARSSATRRGVPRRRVISASTAPLGDATARPVSAARRERGRHGRALDCRSGRATAPPEATRQRSAPRKPSRASSVGRVLRTGRNRNRGAGRPGFVCNVRYLFWRRNYPCLWGLSTQNGTFA